MRPKLQADVIYFPVSDGIYLRKNGGSLRLKGKHVFTWLENLVPYFTGEYSLTQITQGLDAQREEMVTQLVETLLAHQFVRDVEHDDPHELNQEELTTYASEIAFVDSFQPSAASRFERFRQQSLLIIGSGLRVTCLVQAALHCGIKRVSVLLTSEAEPVAASRPDVLDLFRRNDAAQTVQLLPSVSWEDDVALQQLVRTYDAILHISDQPVPGCARALNTACWTLRKPLIQACIVGDQAWLGPLVDNGSEGCWECAWRRLALSGQSDEEVALGQTSFYDSEAVELSRYLVISTAMMIANRLVFELFKYVTQAGPLMIDHSMMAVDLATLSTKEHSFLPDPHCQTCQPVERLDATDFLASIEDRSRQEALDWARFSKEIVPYVDSQLGLFTSIDEGNFVQAPLAVCQVTLTQALLTWRSDNPLRVTGVGADFYNARLRAMQQACEVYAAHCFDERRLLVPEYARQHSSRCIPAEQFLNHQTDAATPLWSWGMDLVTKAASLVPASLVFSSTTHPGAEPLLGVVSGQSWDESLCRALCAWGRFLTLTQMEEDSRAYPLVMMDDLPMTEAGRHLYDVLTTVGQQVTIYDVTGALRIPTFAICLQSSVVAYSTHCDVAQALEQGLEQAVQHYQSVHSQQPDYDVMPVPDLPLSRRDDARTGSYAAIGESWSQRLSLLVESFQQHGLRPIVVPLDHDRMCASLLPTVVRVLVARAEG